MRQETWYILEKEFSEWPRTKGEPVTEYEFDAALVEIGVVSVDADYRQFVSKYGGAQIGNPIYGLRRAPCMGENEESFIIQTKQYRELGWPGIANWLIFSMDGAGNPVGFAEDGKVYVSDTDCAEIIYVCANFEEYLRKECLEIDPRD